MLAESEEGSVSVWKYANGTAGEVARLVLADKDGNGRGCCSEAIWVD